MSFHSLRRLGMLAIAGALTLAATANAAPAKMVSAETRTIVLNRLVCFQTEDWGADEPYINFNGTTVWGPGSLNNGQTAYLNVSRRFTDSVTISLFDDDWPDADDQIGYGHVYVGAAGLGEQSLTFINENGPNYTLYYHVY